MHSNDKDYLPSEMIQRGFKKKDGVLSFNANIFADFVAAQHDIICTNPDTFYVYKEGVYIRYDISHFKSILFNILQEPQYGTWSRYREEEYVKSLERLCYCDEKLNYRKDLINLNNCMFSLNNFKCYKHNSKFLSTIRLPINYIKGAKCPLFKKFLKEIFLEDMELIHFVQEVIGYCISSDNQAQVFFVLYGSGSNGKSLLCNIIKKLVGKGNYSTLSIADLSNSFARADLQDKVLNISAENESANGKPHNSEYIKAISGGDEIKAEYKGKDVFSFEPVCKLVFAVNTLPTFADKTSGFLRRIRIIPFNAQFSIADGTADIHLEEKLTDELSGIFRWAMIGLKRLRENNYRFSECKAVQTMIEEYTEMQNPYIIFFNECVIYDANNKNVKTFKTDVYKRFITWATLGNYSGLAKSTERRFWMEFQTLMKQLNLPNVEFKKTGGKRFAIGLELVQENSIFQYKRNEIKEFDLNDELYEEEIHTETPSRPNTVKMKKNKKVNSTSNKEKRTRKDDIINEKES